MKSTLLDAPTGSGKTLLAEAHRQLSQPRSALYLCSTKTLQDQVLRDFDHVRLIKGKNNYPLRSTPSLFPEMSCGDCIRGQLCHNTGCDYQDAKAAALAAELAVANTSYFLHEANYKGDFSRPGQLVIIDEADQLEGELMDFISLDLPAKWLRWAGVKDHPKVTVEESWNPWLQATKDALIRGPHHQLDFRERQRLTRLVDSITRALPLDEDNWVAKVDRRSGRTSFQPVDVSPWGPSHVFHHGDTHLLMSATIISPFSMAQDLGIPKDTYHYLPVESTFPASRRPVVYIPVAAITKKTFDEAVGPVVAQIQHLANRHRQDKVLIHTVSYRLTEAVTRSLTGHRVFTYDSAQSRTDTLEEFRAYHGGALLVAPSLDRGIDLPYDACRAIIVAKIPYPDLGDPRVKKRLYGHGGRLWYDVQTWRTLVQMTGRGMRAKDDYCVSYILDAQFEKLVEKSGHLAPKWWSEALVKERRSRHGT